MQIEDITNTLNKYLENKRNLERIDIKGHFVVKRNIKTMKQPCAAGQKERRAQEIRLAASLVFRIIPVRKEKVSDGRII